MELLHLQKTLDYVEDHLHHNLVLDELAEVSGYSKFHLDRLFKYAFGESLIEYVRKRKLTEASIDLVSSKERILDIAIKYGFSSQQAFSSSFKKTFGKTPRTYRLKGNRSLLRERLRISQSDIEKAYQLNHTKDQHLVKDAFTLVGLSYFGSNQNHEIPKLWEDFFNHLKIDGPYEKNRGFIGLCEHVPDYDPEKSDFFYMAGYQKKDPEDRIPPGMTTKTLPQQEYLVFTHYGDHENLEATYRYIYGTYFFKSDYEPLEAPDFEYYDHRFLPHDEASEMDIYIPVKRKQK